MGEWGGLVFRLMLSAQLAYVFWVLVELSYDAAVRALDLQERGVERLRARTGMAAELAAGAVRAVSDRRCVVCGGSLRTEDRQSSCFSARTRSRRA
jgi:hypothetical protein